MRYVNNGIEIQYRECQILRETAKDLLNGCEETGKLTEQKDKWLCNLRATAEKFEAKKQYAIPLIGFLQSMDKEYLDAVAEYTISLVKKERGIDIMVPFIATNNVLVLPVNMHTSVMDEFNEDTEEERE